jgi:hypothetical protein
MPSPTRSKTVCLISTRVGETEVRTGVVGTFRRAYQIAIFEQRIAFPNLSERAALETMKKMGRVYIWDTKQFEHLEEAMWRPDGNLVILERVQVKK